MNDARQRRLERAGWRTGSFQDFLGLSDADAAYIRISIALAIAVRETRREREVSRAALAKRVGMTPSAITRLEAGDPTARLDSLVHALLALGISSKQLGRLVADSGAGTKTIRRPRVALARRRPHP
jgi:DNA-binding XRE family transcriptional regulator